MTGCQAPWCLTGGDSRDCGVPEDDLEATVFESCHARHLRPQSIKQGYKPGRTLLHGDGRRASGDRGDTPDPGRARTTRSPAARSRRSTSAGEYPRRDHPGAERRAQEADAARALVAASRRRGCQPGSKDGVGRPERRPIIWLGLLAWHPAPRTRPRGVDCFHGHGRPNHRDAEQRIGTDEVRADGRGPSPLNSVLGRRNHERSSRA